MRVLAACEWSGRVRDAFRRLGHAAYSCDIDYPKGEYQEYHIRDDVRRHLDGWDLIIAFPPCTWLCRANAQARGTNKELNAIDFVWDIMEAECEKIAIENPQYSSINRHIRPADQTIQPWYFGEPYYKPTSLWLKNLPLLEPTNVVLGQKIDWMKGVRDPKRRALTFAGVAEAMAKQWGE